MQNIQHKAIVQPLSVAFMVVFATMAVLQTVRYWPASTVGMSVPAPETPLMFLENKGQLAPNIRFEVHGENTNMVLASDAVWFTRLAANQPDKQGEMQHGVNIREAFVGANSHPRLEPFHALDTRITYLKGNTTQRATQAQAWAGVRYVDLYPGIDLLVTSEAGELVQKLVARSSADLSAVRLQLDGAKQVSLGNGQLQLETAVGSFSLPLLHVEMANGQQITGFEPKLNGNIVSAPFSTGQGFGPPPGKGNTTNSVGLMYGARFGGSEYDRGNGIDVDKQGAAYVVGGTLSSNMPTTPGAFDSSFNGDIRDAFVAKLNPAGNAPEYITYIGGQKEDWGMDIAVDRQGEAFVTGYTASPDFPLSQPVQGFGGQFDAFALKLSASGSAVVYSTYLGGGSDDRAYAIAVDKRGAAYIAGSAGEGFPLANPADASCTNTDGFVVRLSPAGNAREYATCLGGSDTEYANGIGVNDQGEAYVSGVTRSSDFPVTANAFDGSYNGGDDMFIAKVSANGNAFQYATYLGDTGDDVASTAHISVAADGSATVAGYTNSPGFPTTGQALDRSYNGSEDGIVATINAAGNQLLYSTFLGGSADDRPSQVVQTDSGTLYVGGETGSVDFPTTGNAFDRSFGGGRRDVFVTQIVGGNALGYSTFFGGSGDDNGGALAVDDNKSNQVSSDGTTDQNQPNAGKGKPNGNQVSIYVTGSTNSFDYPGTLGAYSAAAQGSSDTFVAKLQVRDDSQAPVEIPTDVPTNTPTNTPTDTPTNTPTNTVIPSPTATTKPGDTPLPTYTPTHTPTRTPSPTPTRTPLPTHTATPADAEETSVPTITPYSTPTNQPGVITEPGVPTSRPQTTPTIAPAPTGRRIFIPLISYATRPIPACNDVEDNDTPAEARPMSPIGEVCSASFRDDPEGEDDYYSVSLRAGQTIQVTLSHIPAQADYDLILYNAGVTQVAVSNKSGEENEQVSYVAAQTGTYVIRINMARESRVATNEYQLMVSIR